MNWRDKIRKCWDQLPRFMITHETVRADIITESEDAVPTPWVVKDIDQANMITSREQSSYGVRYHRPVLDLDFDAQLLPSSTPGHHHLFLDKMLTWEQYKKLLYALAEAGIVQRGFVDCSVDRGATSVRLPWIRKNDWAANQADPEAKTKEIQREIERLEQEAARLRGQLDEALPF